MDQFQKNYGVQEDTNTDNYHRSRRMFCILDGKLQIAAPNLPYSHAVWFKNEGWITEADDSAMATIVRGYVDAKGDVYFYIGYDFQVTKEAEATLFFHLKELSEALSLSPNAHVFGGAIKQEGGSTWPPRKAYGSLEKHLV